MIHVQPRFKGSPDLPYICKFLFSRTQKVNDPCGQHIYIQEQCSTVDIDKDK